MQVEHTTRTVPKQGISHDLVYSKDCANVDTGINITASIERIKHDTILSLVSIFDDDSLVEFLRHKHGGLARCTQGIDHDIIRENVEFLLLFPLHICVAGQTNTSDPCVMSVMLRWAWKSEYMKRTD
jgi:hypothetical protein